MEAKRLCDEQLVMVNNISKIFREDWTGVKVIQKPPFYSEIDCYTELFKRDLINFTYIDSTYRERFISAYLLSSPYYYSPNYNDPAMNLGESTKRYIELNFPKFCDTILGVNFSKQANVFDSFNEMLQNSGEGVKTAFYIYFHLIVSKISNLNLLIDNAELSLHFLSTGSLKKYVETNLKNNKVIFLMNRYDLFDSSVTDVRDLYLLHEDGKIDCVNDYKFNRDNKSAYNLNKMLTDGYFGDEWKVYGRDVIIN